MSCLTILSLTLVGTNLPPGQVASQTTAFPQTVVEVIGYGSDDRGRISNQISLPAVERVR